jgi:hypothetical protein
VRIVALVAQGGALTDAKAVLFVDNRQLQVGELDRVFDQGVGANQDFDIARFETRLDFAALPGVGVAGEQTNLFPLRARLQRSGSC